MSCICRRARAPWDSLERVEKHCLIHGTGEALELFLIRRDWARAGFNLWVDPWRIELLTTGEIRDKISRGEKI